MYRNLRQPFNPMQNQLHRDFRTAMASCPPPPINRESNRREAHLRSDMHVLQGLKAYAVAKEDLEECECIVADITSLSAGSKRIQHLHQDLHQETAKAVNANDFRKCRQLKAEVYACFAEATAIVHRREPPKAATGKPPIHASPFCVWSWDRSSAEFGCAPYNLTGRLNESLPSIVTSPRSLLAMLHFDERGRLLWSGLDGTEEGLVSLPADAGHDTTSWVATIVDRTTFKLAIPVCILEGWFRKAGDYLGAANRFVRVFRTVKGIEVTISHQAGNCALTRSCHKLQLSAQTPGATTTRKHRSLGSADATGLSLFATVATAAARGNTACSSATTSSRFGFSMGWSNALCRRRHVLAHLP
jgi:hypothetical protein